MMVPFRRTATVFAVILTGLGLFCLLPLVLYLVMRHTP
jgi:hypothetical protein